MTDKTKYGLIVSDINSLRIIFQENKQITEAILFGSRALGTFNVGSDIDIALKGHDLGLTDIISVSLEIDKLFLPNKIDLIIYNRIKEKALTDHIDRVGITLYKDENSGLNPNLR